MANRRKITPIAVVGSREFPDKHLIKEHLDDILRKAIKRNLRLHIISGGAKGVDTWATDWALENQVMYTVIPAEWNLFGKKAGYLRNEEIWELATAGIAFWDGDSPGTQHSFKLAQQQCKKCKIVFPVGHEPDDLPW